ncbi:hypothetical protein BBD42_21620 [Paenibacillus sp. BIHB 4019]|uniref:Uncharacterized protein n=1 Tax=Paenibacillus sp. BIHB 4019 TaxID=1870819 RepID=A0A1B2DM40_9BACL|nr:hypothetical protein [Paenibacillus sp. BIHB 4019]ANY68776.1 hypothetical protein BBD42_21620 [Paenibacillus sp. BIHB 4019]
MENKKSLLSVDENAILSEEFSKAPLVQKLSLFTCWIPLLLTIYLWYKLQFWWGVLALLVFIIMAGSGLVIDTKAKDRVKKQKDKALDEIITANGITNMQKYVAEYDDFAVVVDELKERLYFIDYEIREFSLSDVLEVEMIEDEVQITKTSRGSQLGGAVIGGLIAGGVGAVIGGVSGTKTTSSDSVKRIYMKLIVDDTKRPYVTVNFLNEKKEISKKDKKAEKAIEDANHWYGLISVLINRAV